MDPNSKVLQRLAIQTEGRLKASQDLPGQILALQTNPNNRQALGEVIQSLMILGRVPEADALISNSIMATPQDVPFLRDMINFYATQNRFPQALEVTKALEKAQPDQWDVPFTIAKYELVTGDRAKAYDHIRKSVQLGGNAALQQIAREQLFQQVAGDPAFQAALRNESLSDASKPEAVQGLLNAIQGSMSKKTGGKINSN